MSVPGSLRWRARNMALGSVLGAAFCFPLGNFIFPSVVLLVSMRRGSNSSFNCLNNLHCLSALWMCVYLLNFVSINCLAGWIHLKLVEMANEGNSAANPPSDQREVKSGVSAAIERLEGNLSK